MDRAAFLQDEKTQSAVIRELTVIGEAANHTSESYREAHAMIPWRRLIQLRHFYVHGYRRVDYREVWRDVSRLAAQLPAELAQLVPREPDATP